MKKFLPVVLCEKDTAFADLVFQPVYEWAAAAAEKALGAPALICALPEAAKAAENIKPLDEIKAAVKAEAPDAVLVLNGVTPFVSAQSIEEMLGCFKAKKLPAMAFSAAGEIVGVWYKTERFLGASAHELFDFAEYELLADDEEGFAAHDREALRALRDFARDRIFDRLAENGVDILCEDGVIISPKAEIAPCTIYPGTIIKGATVIGEGCVIGPNTLIENCTIGQNTVINSSQLHDSVVKNSVRIGPFCYVRPGCVIDDKAKIGDFVELKNSNIGESTSVSHLTYIGDSDVGKRVNFGCGVVTVNYDGQKKPRTVVGDGAFVGCNVNLVAPVRAGEGCYIAAGSTITEDVPDDALAIARERQTNKPGYAKGRYSKR